MSYLQRPLSIDGRGRLQLTNRAGWVRGLIEEVLFTSPGERVNRPDFGSGLKQLIFSPGGTETAIALEGMVEAALQRWVGEYIHLEGLKVEADNATLRVTVQYILRQTGERTRAEFSRSF